MTAQSEEETQTRNKAKANPWLLSVAPMMDWTDRHCRYFHRLITRHTLLYTEMVTTGALLHGDVERHLAYSETEHPVALQLGGSEPVELAQSAALGQQWGYDEVNLNCGCPSERVQKGAFGACLMQEPKLVADCVRAMRAEVDVPVTVKHRIGIDKIERYEFMREFVDTVAQAGCTVFIVHARNAWLKGLSPKENRSVPPLRYELVYKLKEEFPELTIVLNGGVKDNSEVAQHLNYVDGVMLGRQAYHQPMVMADWDVDFWNAQSTELQSNQQRLDANIVTDIERDMVSYMQKQAEQGVPWWYVARHMLGLRHGMPGARKWRQVWSDHKNKKLPAQEVFEMAQSVLH